MKTTTTSVLSSVGQVSSTDSKTVTKTTSATQKRSSTRKRVVIVGAGFAGLYAAKKLKSANVDVLLIDKNNYHTFQPLLYQVATSALNPDEIAHSVRATFRNQKNFD